ncbi:restriction endonuclease [Priestia aryabhattai]|uniref:nSTAND3 domain-containing NTPase n=1 Tax=Priestia aryabhattai TaxID=412384 RepID=UPI00310135D2
MYDFTNLSDVEFEKLCGDILSRKFKVKLRYFAAGRDGGIDLVDDSAQKNLIVQVKHYAKSSFSGLLTSLKKEVPKVQQLKPKQYYICVSQQLTAANINEIYELFKDYMKDTSNIITRDILVEFLDQDSNQDILRKNFKLWLLSDKLLKDIFNNKVFIDSDVLLDEIDEEFKFFVQTKVFNEALEILRASRVLMLQGGPGVGKSINSKMLASAFVKEGYIIRYTTDGQVSNIKNVISEDPNVKEVILLDDCLGQYYFNLKKGQDRELISLMQYIKQHKNKVLILNKRVTIFNEAKRARLEFRRHLEKNKLPLRTINMEDISIEEKAEIFYNHLLKNKIPKVYYDTLKENRRYKNIINHKNYNPRIIEFVTEEYRYGKVDPKDYYEYILKNLNNPNDVWADEFEEKLDEIDRIFMHTLFSLTDTYIDIDILEECFIHRLDKDGLSKSTVDHFSAVKSRLTKSLIRLFDDDGSKKIGVLNPSINDYLNNHIRTNKIGLNTIRQSILYIEQLERMYEEEAAERILIDKLRSGEFIELKSKGNKKTAHLFYGITKFNITNDSYKKIIRDNFCKLSDNLSYFDKKLEKNDLVIKFLEEPVLYEFYDIGENLKDDNFMDDFTSDIGYKGLSKVLFLVKNKKLAVPNLLEELSSYFLYDLDNYLSEFEVYDYIDGIDGFEAFYDLIHVEETEDNGEEIEQEIQKLLSTIRADIKEEIRSELDKTIGFELFQERIEKMIEENISKDKIYESLDQYFNPEPDYDSFKEDYYEEDRGFELGDEDGTEVIFDREYIELDE